MRSNNDNTAKVTLVGGKEVVLPISSQSKPEISPLVMEKWQRTVNLSSKAFGVPVGLITHLTPKTLDISIASNGKGNIFSPGQSLPLGTGMYCETTAGTRSIVQVYNATECEEWKDNPSVAFDLISYLGMPLRWPDGELFGTFCMLDSQPHEYSDTHMELLEHFRNTIELDLAMLLERNELKRLNVEKDLTLREAHHRIKNHLSMLAGVLQIKGSDSAEVQKIMDDFLGRIQAIAKLHSRIAAVDETNVDLNSFVHEIANSLLTSISCCEAKLVYNAEHFEVSRESFFHTGLLVSELVTNSIKHAFDGVDTPEIHITIQDKDKDYFTLHYRDNGVGLPEDFAWNDSNTIGMNIILDIPSKTGGGCEISTGKETAYNFVLGKS